MIPMKDARLNNKQKLAVSKAWHEFSEIVELHANLSLAEFIKVCPAEYELVRYENGDTARCKYAVYNKLPWQFCLYFSPMVNRLVLQTDVSYFNSKTEEWEATSFNGI